MHWIFRLFVGLLTAGLVVSSASADPINLYDGTQNTAPNQQGWSFRYLPLFPAVGQTVSGGLTTVDTTASLNTQAGYFTTDPLGINGVHPKMPLLNRAVGYTVDFGVRVQAEDHGSRVDRAGFSVIVLGTDLKGIELGFWTNEIWAQADSPMFTHAEGVARDTTVLTNYALSVLGSNYTLYADGSPILTGPLRDYSAFGAPYNTANQIFLGDDTTSAGARFSIAHVNVNLAAVPEPSGLILISIGGMLVVLGGGVRARCTRHGPKGVDSCPPPTSRPEPSACEAFAHTTSRRSTSTSHSAL